jgi:hypothetical protein
MEIIRKYGVMKNNQFCLYDNFDESMTIEFRKLKGKYYKKNNFWSFPKKNIFSEDDDSIEKQENIVTNVTNENNVCLNENQNNFLDINESITNTNIDDNSSLLSSNPSEKQEISIQTDLSIVPSENLSYQTDVFSIHPQDNIYNSSDNFSNLSEQLSEELSEPVSVENENFSIDSNELLNDQDNKKYKFNPPDYFYHYIKQYI